MGAICTKPNTNLVSNPAQFSNSNSDFPPVIPVNNAHPHAFLDEILFINTKYNDCFTIQKNIYSGEGIRKTYGYICHVTQEELMKKREEFWDTRTEGNIEAWQTIKAALSNDENSTLAILKASGLELIKNSIQSVFDETGMKYDTPIFCINEPISYEIRKNSSGSLPANFKKEMIEFKIRCAKLSNDVTIKTENNVSVKEIKEQFIKIANNINCDDLVLRMFIRGKEMKDQHFVGEFDISNDDMVQIFLQTKS